MGKIHQLHKITPQDLAQTSLEIIDKKLKQEQDLKEKISLLKERTATILTHILPELNRNAESKKENDLQKYSKILEDTAKELENLGEEAESIYILWLTNFFKGNYKKAENYLFYSIINWKKDVLPYWLLTIEQLIS